MLSTKALLLALALAACATAIPTSADYAETQLVIEDLREKREELNKQILKEEKDKSKIQKELSALTHRLQKINVSLVRKTQVRNEYDKTIQETEAAYKHRLASAGPPTELLVSQVPEADKGQVTARPEAHAEPGGVGDSKAAGFARVERSGGNQ